MRETFFCRIRYNSYHPDVPVYKLVGTHYNEYIVRTAEWSTGIGLDYVLKHRIQPEFKLKSTWAAIPDLI